MKAEIIKKRIFCKRMLAVVMAAASLSTMGCAKKTEDDTFVMIDVGFIASEQEFIEKYGEDGTYVSIGNFVTPEPVVTPVPTPEPTPEPTKKPRSTPKPEKDRDEEREEEKKKDREEDSEAEATPAPSKKTVGKTPYADKYERVSIDYASSSEGITFQTTTFDGEAVSESIFARNGITMVNIWTQTWVSCLEEMGSLSNLAYKYKGTGFSIIGLSADVPSGSVTTATAKELFASAGGKFTNLTYTDSVIETLLEGVNVVPTTKFYDSNGRLLTVIHGAKDEQGWINIIETVINEKA